ncbi:hypothetical protein EO98_07430 [Methanosarcina sp. 2.H.T.1A.6]|uniref:hypothetical protein n=1 Tax=unclassified Methanosarcina TaxID=2644672 RepID=UPI000621EBE4|nr:MULTISPECIES: hypothetical protein [unclassified Methanosarcina]KKG12791.1 hypothetical protein EO97_00635 [Methanosarcina sp. 2.H.T.1A.15]KKG18995.1 hypothetical protein EO94_15045 [Methanosarcina sp. 2.H.T.1A.3]KKG21548.1 hypothetical protein EO98_07430 [Methanosarcina sp. 2.H.T.1A.6]KKG21593.1 hypothetical protein EO96_11835 [Methanosarcina sp. 2.H.T.1A.8]
MNTTPPEELFIQSCGTDKKITDFLKDHVIDKKLITDEVVYQLEEGKLEGVYSDEMFFSNLVLSEHGFRFDMTTVTREKIYILDPDRKRGAIKKDFNGVSVFRYELAERKSTSRITGIMRLASSTVREHTMEGIAYGVYDLQLENSQLSWKEQQLLYRDMPADNDNYRPVAFDAKVRFHLENGKLRFEYIPKYYDFEPEKLTRKLSKDQYPAFVTKER